MKRIVFSLFWLVVLGGLAWGNGEEIRYDPNTGVILPAGPTQAQVEREKLEVEFRLQEGSRTTVWKVSVRAQYWLRNPTDKPLKLQIGFPVPGSAVQLMETPVRLDGQPVEWRLLEYEELLKPLRASLIRAVKRWADRHPHAIRLSGEMRGLCKREMSHSERRRREETLRGQLRAELVKSGATAPSREAYNWLFPSAEAPRAYQNTWNLRNALLVTGQRRLLPEGRWYVDQTVLDPATGRQVWPRPEYGYDRSVTMLIFPLHLQPDSRHHLKVTYQQLPSKHDDESVYHFGYILRTVRGWASFGPIECTVKAPAGLIFRSLPRLAYAGMSGGMKAYQGVIVAPRRNLQVVLGTQEMLWPRLKINGGLAGRRHMMIGGIPVIRFGDVADYVQGSGRIRWEGGEVVVERKGVTLRARPGEKQMLVNGQPASLGTPAIVRKGSAYLPEEALQALYPECKVTVSYHAASNTVLVGIIPRPKASAPPPG